MYIYIYIDREIHTHTFINMNAILMYRLYMI